MGALGKEKHSRMGARIFPHPSGSREGQTKKNRTPNGVLFFLVSRSIIIRTQFYRFVMALGLLFSYKTSKTHNIIIDENKNMVYNNMKEKKYFIDAVLEKEKQRNEKMRSAYEKRVLELSRGSLLIRELNGKKFGRGFLSCEKD